MSSNITSGAWWKDAFFRALRTALVIAVPYLGGSLLSAVPWLTIVSAAGLGFVASFITSLAGLPDANSQPLWLATLVRVAKTVAQSLAAGVANIVLFQDVPWSIVLQASAVAGLGSLLMALIGNIPAEAVPPTQAVVLAPVATGPVPIQSSVVANNPDEFPAADAAPVAPAPVVDAPVAPAVPDITADGGTQQ